MGQTMVNETGADTRVARRRFLRSAVAGAVVAVAAPSKGWKSVRVVIEAPRRPLTPDSAFSELLEGNRRFVDNQLASRSADLAVLRARTADKQQPFAAVLGCADSRVPVELLFDQSIGQIFVARLAGNFVTSEITASLEYAVAVLGVSAILVLGHTHCGAVKAAMKTESVPGQISSLYPHLRAAVDGSDGDVEKAVRLNTTIQAELLRTSSTVIREAITKGSLKVGAGVYDLATGRVAVS